MAQFLVTSRDYLALITGVRSYANSFNDAVVAAEKIAVENPGKEFLIFKAVAVSQKADAITTMLDSRRELRDGVMCNCDGCAD